MGKENRDDPCKVGMLWAAGVDTGEARTLDCSGVLVTMKTVQ